MRALLSRAVVPAQSWELANLQCAWCCRGGGLGAIESSAWAGGSAAIGALFGGLISYAQDGDEDADGVHDRRDTCPGTPANTPVNPNGCTIKVYAPALPQRC
jgi:hypothetical protein